MMPRIRADEEQRTVDALLYAGGRSMNNESRAQFEKRQQRELEGGRGGREGVQRITPQLAGLLGMTLNESDEGEEVNE